MGRGSGSTARCGEGARARPDRDRRRRARARRGRAGDLLLRLGLIIVAVGGAPAALGVGPASAGDYHAGSASVCTECHDNGRVIERSEINRLCLSCHGSRAGTAPPVLDANPSAVPRQAGALNGAGGGLPHTTGHTLASPAPAPGGTWAPGAGGLTCTDCHAAHGEVAQYRNLVRRPGAAPTDRRISYSSGPVNDRSKDVWLKPATTVAGRYAARNVGFNQPDPTQSAYAAWCQGCHTVFHGAPGASNMGGAAGGATQDRHWTRHPTVGVAVGAGGNRSSSFARYAALENRVPTLSASGNWPARDNVVSCMSCHKAHGNRNPFGLLHMSGSGEITEEGDTGGGFYTHLCRQCHTQGLS